MNYSDLALKHANGMSFKDVLDLHAQEVLREAMRRISALDRADPQSPRPQWYYDGYSDGLSAATEEIDPDKP